MSGPLNGKRALVTGASRGIGAAIAKRLAADGADVAVTYASSADAANAVVADIQAHGRTGLAIKADGYERGALAGAVRETVATLGGIDILVNNAGTAVFKPLPDLTDDDFDAQIALNVRGPFEATREAIQHMGEGGRIIVIGSVNGERIPGPGGSLYSATKGAVKMFVQGWARDLGPRAITVNTIAPGPVDTDLNPADGDFAQVLAPMTALARYGRVEEIAALTAFVASPHASYVTGAHLTVDGGLIA